MPLGAGSDNAGGVEMFLASGTARGGADVMTHPASVSEGGEVTECRSRSMATRAGRYDKGRPYDCVCPTVESQPQSQPFGRDAGL